MKFFYMLVGVPGSGKSTWLKNKILDRSPSTAVISSDDIISEIAETIARMTGVPVTYNDVFSDNYKLVEKFMLQNAERIFASDDANVVVWDQTNVSVLSRKKKLAMVPKDYKKIAVFFETPPDDILKERLSKREGKTIPNFVMVSMKENLVKPSENEGFDIVQVVNTFY